VGVYSTLLFRGSVPNGDISAFTTPAGMVAIVRDIDVVVRTGGASGFSFFDDATGTEFWRVKPVPSDTVQQWRGRQVLNAGDTLDIENNNADEFSCWVSGWLLQL
jgi:hypothetical protein